MGHPVAAITKKGVVLLPSSLRTNRQLKLLARGHRVLAVRGALLVFVVGRSIV